MEIVFAIIFFIIGICIGSFLNVIADRVPAGKSIVSPPSHCFKCGHKLGPSDLIPVISYLWLKGKCRYCHAPIPLKSILVELFTGIAFSAAIMLLGVHLNLISSLMVISIFIVLGITDINNSSITLIITLPSTVLLALIAVVHTLLGLQPDIKSAFIGFIVAAGIMSLLWLVFRVLQRRFIGFGHIAMAGLAGISLGFPLSIIALSLAAIISGLAVLIIIIFKREHTSDSSHINLFLALISIVFVLWAKEITATTAILPVIFGGKVY